MGICFMLQNWHQASFGAMISVMQKNCDFFNSISSSNYIEVCANAIHMSITIAIHGGAGTLLPEYITQEQVQAYTKALDEALEAGYAILNSGGTAIDAVAKAVQLMEDCELFNAGKGAVFTNNQTHELDASIMCGHTSAAGAVAGVQRVKNPILLAKNILQHSDHVMLTGVQAEAFATLRNQELVDPKWFDTAFRLEQLQDAIAAGTTQLDHTVKEDQKFGTVGAVALDSQGHLAAATSTGGITNKRFGRVGDTPIIGAGTYANEQVAISCTGWGEYYIRVVAAHEVAALVRYAGNTLEQAAQTVLDRIGALGGDGGLIALNAQGEVALSFITPGMYRAAMGASLPKTIAIFK
jgi:L-asparaginase / beta-aspartyl-peptidase